MIPVHRATATLIVLAILAADRSAQASPDDVTSKLFAAQRAVGDMRLEEAYQLYLEAEALGESGPLELRNIIGRLGTIAFALGREDDARGHLRRLAALDPAASLPEGTSPRIVELLEEARREVEPISSSHRVSEEPVLIVEIENDPEGWITGASLQVAGAEPVEARRDGDSFRFPISADRTRATVVLHDERGNELIRRELSWALPAPRADDDQAGPQLHGQIGDKEEGRSWYTRWWLWGGAAVAAGGVGVAFGLRAADKKDEIDRRSAESEQHFFDDVAQLRDDMDRDARVANIAWITGGVLVVASGALLAWELSSDDQGGRGGPVVGVGDDFGAIGYAGRF